MKKLTALALVLVALLVSINTGSAQTTVTLGTGTSYNTTTGYPAPYGQWYTTSKIQCIILASELTGLGITANSQISAIGFNVAVLNNCATKPANMSIGTISRSSFSGTTDLFETGLTQVWSSTNYTPTTGWNTHSFTSNFTWDGTSNIVVQFCYNLSETSSYTQNASTYYTTLGWNSTLNYRTDGSSYACPYASGNVGQNNQRPNMQITYTPGGGGQGGDEDTPQVACAGKTIVSPPDAFLPGIHPVTLRVTNPSETENLTSFDVDWSVDGVAQPTVSVLQLIEPGESADIVLGQIDFQYKPGFGTYLLEASVSNPNGDEENCEAPNEARCEDNVADPRNVSPAMAPGTYYIGGADPHFSNLAEAIDFLAASGVVGDGAITFSLRPGNYEGSAIFDGGVLNNPINIVGEGGNPNNVVLRYNVDCEYPSNYMFEIYNVNGFNVSGCTFIVGGDCGMGGIFYFEDCQGVNFTNNRFYGISNVEPMYADSYILINIQNSNGYTFTDNRFYDNGISVMQEIDDPMYCPRSISFMNNQFQGFSYQGCYLDNMACTNSSVLFQNNKFLGQSGVQPINGIYSANGNDAIIGNTFSGFTGSNTSGQAAVYISRVGITTTDGGGEGAPAATGNIIVDGNQFSQMQDLQGVRIEGADNVDILHNTLTISFSSAQYDSRGISLNLAPNSNANIAYNNLTVLNGYVPMWVQNVSSSICDYNRFHNDIGPFGLFYYFSYDAYMANNQISSNNGQAFQCAFATAELYHNTMSTNAEFQPTMYIAGSSDITLRRNIIQNLGEGPALMQYSNFTPMMDENSFFSGGTTVIDWLGVQVPVAFDQNNQLDLEGTLANIRNMAPAADPNLNSYFNMIELVSETDLNLNHYYREIVSTTPMFTDWRFNAFEAIDFEDMPRNGAYYMGSDNIQPEIEIVSEPIEVVDCYMTEGTSFIVVATATQGVELMYQWYRDGVMLPGENQAVLFLDALDYDMQGIYHCVVTGAGAPPLMTDYASLYVLRPVEIKYQPEDTQVETGGTAVFEVEMQIYKDEFMDAHPEYMPEYQWYLATTPPTPLYDEDMNGEKYAGAQASIFTLSNVQDSDREYGYYCVITGHCGTKTTNVVNIVGAPDYTIVQQPIENGGCEGTDIQMSIEATPTGAATDLMYQWYKDDVAIMDDDHYTGTSTAILTVKSILPEHDGNYSVEISTVPAGNSGMSDQARLLVQDAPAIVNQPTTMEVTAGEKLEITIEASGFAPLTYEWMQDGTPIDYISSPTFEVEAAEEGNAGVYTCKVINDCGEVMTEEITVTVNTGGISGVYTSETPDGFILYAAQPNPVKDETEVKYYAPKSASVVITIQDMSGKQIASIPQTAHTGENFVNINTLELGLVSGSYYYTLNVNGNKVTKKMVVIK
jgi:hypothetical protein